MTRYAVSVVEFCHHSYCPLFLNYLSSVVCIGCQAMLVNIFSLKPAIESATTTEWCCEIVVQGSTNVRWSAIATLIESSNALETPHVF